MGANSTRLILIQSFLHVLRTWFQLMNCTRSCCHVECEMAFGILSFRYKKATYSEHSRSIFETNSERKRERERKMADTSGGDAVRPVVICDNKCGCTVPCTGGSTCRSLKFMISTK